MHTIPSGVGAGPSWRRVSSWTGAPLGLALLLTTAAIAAAQPTTAILVRHAERADEPRNDPILTDAGAQRARDLMAALRYAGVTSVITTQLQRTRLTALPLADSLGITPRVVRAGGMPVSAHADSVAAAVRARRPGEVVLVVGHSNTIPAIIAALGGPRLADLCESQYASLFILELRAGGAPRMIHATFGAADPPQATDCNRMIR
jgi:broad specificity phosphatase PhoE